jgi:hypothetical protein
MTGTVHPVDVQVLDVGAGQDFVAEMAAAGIGVAFLERRVAYPLIGDA